jgi:hypothetical protein
MNIKTIIIATAITPIISISAALAASNGEVTRATNQLSGIVLKVDRPSRTMVVREESGRETTVYVPAGCEVALSRTGNLPTESSTISFERAHRGLHVNMRTTAPSARAAIAEAR